ncbi:MAG: phosphatidate cytidylyltransferase [Flavicella sp.]
MNNMIKRALFGTVYVLVLITCITYNETSFFLLFFVLMLISIFEFSKMIQSTGFLIYGIGSLLMLSKFDVLSNLTSNYLQSGAILLFCFLFVKELFDKENNAIHRISQAAILLVYTVVPYIFIVKIPYTNLNNTYEYIVILMTFILIWANDSFAYLIGKSIGKHKLFERISPNKTIEGFVGGVLATMTISYIIGNYFQILTPIQWSIVGAIVSIFGVLGDLIASQFKRITKVKDTGKIIPGHGGIIDRLDSAIFASPFIYIYLKFILENVS